MTLGAAQHELAQLARELTGALQAHDAGRLDGILAREFSLVGRGTLDRERCLEDAAGPYEIDEWHYDEVEVEIYGDTAVLSSRYRQTARLDGTDLSGAYLLTDVWVRRDGRWQLVRRHATNSS